MLLMEKPAKAARLCGLTRLTDTLHGRWIREMVFGQGDMTLLAHRGSYKTTCLSFAMAVMLVVYPRKTCCSCARRTATCWRCCGR